MIALNDWDFKWFENTETKFFLVILSRLIRDYVIKSNLYMDSFILENCYKFCNIRNLYYIRNIVFHKMWQVFLKS